MDFNSFVFPCPKFDYNKVYSHQNQIIYIPTEPQNPLSSKIPCLFIHPPN